MNIIPSKSEHEPEVLPDETKVELNVEIPPENDKTEPEISIKKEDSDQPAVAIDAELWDEILNKLKKKNNTLYGIARMAEAEHSNQTLLLKFKFAFHYKKFNQPTNKSILSAILDELGHKGVILEISLADKSQPQTVNTAKKDDISSITDIFGSGEVLES